MEQEKQYATLRGGPVDTERENMLPVTDWQREAILAGLRLYHQTVLRSGEDMTPRKQRELERLQDLVECVAATEALLVVRGERMRSD